MADDDQKPPEDDASLDADLEEGDAQEPESGVVEESDELDLDGLDDPKPEPGA